MTVSDSFTLAIDGDICNVITHSELTGEKLKQFLEFAFGAYSPIVVLSEAVQNTNYAYTFAQKDGIIDPGEMLRILSSREIGWNLIDGMLFSPRPSQLRPTALRQAISAARMQNTQVLM